MGATYASTVVFGSGLEAVRRACDRPAYLAEVGDAVAVFSRADDEFEPTAPRLSGELTGAVVWSVSVYDSDLLTSAVYVDGREVTTSTVPDPAVVFGDVEADATGGTATGPDADALVAAIGRGEADVVRAVLEADEVFAEDRHAKLCAAVGVDERVAGCGYRYLAVEPRGWRPGELEHLS